MKLANIVVVGGHISAGKSSLVEALPYSKVFELEADDTILKLLLQDLYAKKRVASEAIEYYFLKLREKNYELIAQDNNLHIFDRSIFESIIFARNHLNDRSFKLFNKLWLTTVKTLIKHYGKPKLYILLEINWKTFKQRFFKRDNKFETNNFNYNEDFFKKHIQEYIAAMETILKRFKIQYKIVNTNKLTVEETAVKVKQELAGL